MAGLRGSAFVAIPQTLKIMKIHASNYPSPLGEILLLATPAGLKGVYFHGQRYFPEADPAWEWNDAPLAATRLALDAYFSGRPLPTLPQLDLSGSAFQQRVWNELLRIPVGETASYGEIARRIGAPAAVRAVGAAIGRNPVSILIPCHRVVGTNGNLTGYAGGLERKSWLLEKEARHQGWA